MYGEDRHSDHCSKQSRENEESLGGQVTDEHRNRRRTGRQEVWLVGETRSSVVYLGVRLETMVNQNRRFLKFS